MYRYTVDDQEFSGPLLNVMISGMVVVPLSDPIPNGNFEYRSSYMLLDPDEDIYVGTYTECFLKLLKLIESEISGAIFYHRFGEGVVRTILDATTITRI